LWLTTSNFESNFVSRASNRASTLSRKYWSSRWSDPISPRTEPTSEPIWLSTEPILASSPPIADLKVRLKLTVCQLRVPKIAVVKAPMSTHTCGSVNTITFPLSWKGPACARQRARLDPGTEGDRRHLLTPAESLP